MGSRGDTWCMQCQRWSTAEHARQHGTVIIVGTPAPFNGPFASTENERDLLAEVERQRAALAAAAAREAALVAVVRAVAEADNSDEGVCLQICDGSYNIGDGCFEHSERCMLGQARALLASAASEPGEA